MYKRLWVCLCLHNSYAKNVMCTQGSAIEVEDILSMEIEAMKTSIEHCLEYAKETEKEFDKVNTIIHLPHI